MSAIMTDISTWSDAPEVTRSVGDVADLDTLAVALGPRVHVRLVGGCLRIYQRPLTILVNGSIFYNVLSDKTDRRTDILDRQADWRAEGRASQENCISEISSCNQHFPFY